jgi:hypothetical protein
MSGVARRAVVLLLLAGPASAAGQVVQCGWCGDDAQALGRALNLGGEVYCRCADPDPDDEKNPTQRLRRTEERDHGD